MSKEWKIDWVELNSLKPHPKNRNDHPKEQIERLAQIIDYQGWRHPIVVSKLSGYIVAGHGRLLAAQALGLSLVPVHLQDFESDDQEYAFLISDNAIALWAELDLSTIQNDLPDVHLPSVDLLGIEDFQFEPDPNENDADAVPEVPKEAKTKRGELWALGSHRLLIEDCTVKENVERLMGGEKADILFTSPPYSDLRDYGGNLTLDPAHLAKFFDWPAKTFFVNLGLIIREREIVQYWDAYLSEAKARGLKLLAWNIWDKGNASAPAHQQAMFGLCHEWIFAFGEYRTLNLTNPNALAGERSRSTRTVREKDGSLSKKTSESVREFRQLDSVIRLRALKNSGAEYTGEHPAAFPLALCEEYIEAATRTGNLVAEPFTGSGSTLIACEKTNRRCFGMEIEPLYADVILTRYAKFSGKDPVREDGVKWSALNGTPI